MHIGERADVHLTTQEHLKSLAAPHICHKAVAWWGAGTNGRNSDFRGTAMLFFLGSGHTNGYLHALSAAEHAMHQRNQSVRDSAQLLTLTMARKAPIRAKEWSRTMLAACDTLASLRDKRAERDAQEAYCTPAAQLRDTPQTGTLRVVDSDDDSDVHPDMSRTRASAGDGGGSVASAGVDAGAADGVDVDDDGGAGGFGGDGDEHTADAGAAEAPGSAVTRRVELPGAPDIIGNAEQTLWSACLQEVSCGLMKGAHREWIARYHLLDELTRYCAACAWAGRREHEALNSMHYGARHAARLNVAADKAVAADVVRRDAEAIVSDLEREGGIQPLAAVEPVPYRMLRHDEVPTGGRQWAEAFNAILTAAQAGEGDDVTACWRALLYVVQYGVHCARGGERLELRQQAVCGRAQERLGVMILVEPDGIQAARRAAVAMEDARDHLIARLRDAGCDVDASMGCLDEYDAERSAAVSDAHSAVPWDGLAEASDEPQVRTVVPPLMRSEVCRALGLEPGADDEDVLRAAAGKLGVAVNASANAVKRNFRELARRTHPDRGDTQVADFIAVDVAYNCMVESARLQATAEQRERDNAVDRDARHRPAARFQVVAGAAAACVHPLHRRPASEADSDDESNDTDDDNVHPRRRRVEHDASAADEAATRAMWNPGRVQPLDVALDTREAVADVVERLGTSATRDLVPTLRQEMRADARLLALVTQACTLEFEHDADGIGTRVAELLRAMPDSTPRGGGYVPVLADPTADAPSYVSNSERYARIRAWMAWLCHQGHSVWQQRRAASRARGGRGGGRGLAREGRGRGAASHRGRGRHMGWNRSPEWPGYGKRTDR